jgi:UDP:flavonoid glycosyltransferase YjiC (YdhE family)
LPFAEIGGRYYGSFPPDAMRELSPDQRLEHLVVHGLVGIAAPAMADDLVPLAREWRPDVVIGNPGEHAGDVAAAVVGVPHVVHGFGPQGPADDIDRAIRAAVRRLHSRWGVDAARADAHTGEPYLDIWPRGTNLRPEHWAYPEIWPLRPESAMPLPTVPPRPALLTDLPYDHTAYVTLGTTYNTAAGVLETMVAALRDDRLNVVVTIGENGDTGRFGKQPENVRIQRFIPQAEILPYCDVVVCHAGAGTVLGALAHGIPLVMAPVASDQHKIAAQVAGAGAGLVCSGETPATADAVRQASDKVSSDVTYRSAADRIREQIHSMPTSAVVVGQLEKYVAVS